MTNSGPNGTTIANPTLDILEGILFKEQEFLRTKKRSAAVPWVDRFELEFPNPSAGDEVPAKADLA